MEDSKWLREDRSSSKSIVGGQLGDNGERLAGVNPNLSPHQGRRGKDTTRLEGINYGGEDVRYMELRSNTKEIPIGVIDTKKRQRLYSMSSIALKVKYKWWEKDEKEVPIKFEAIGTKLNYWAKVNQLGRQRQAAYWNVRLEELNANTPDEENLAELTEIKLTLILKVYNEELFSEQHERANWLRFGDSNTSYFHSIVSAKTKKRTQFRSSRTTVGNGLSCLNSANKVLWKWSNA
ncbi:hypothetical protein GOBAR_DD18878 [Gossypium barbadense]|nr:hypothetical protein GOBAR_DD18878 [Gossypium barbadense]